MNSPEQPNHLQQKFTDLRKNAENLFKELQSLICLALEDEDGKATFSTDSWKRIDESTGQEGGGGVSRILRSEGVFEQAGVNFSSVYGQLPRVMQERFNLGPDLENSFFASGVSLVIHPLSPHVPTVHANFRYFNVGSIAWFGGGADLTPYVFKEEDAVHFHRTLKDSCDKFSSGYYPRFKKECDSYFYIPHRGETRGIGGVFFDYLGKDEPEKLDHYFEFTKAVGQSFINAYLPIVSRRKNNSFTEREREFQLLRRGRYVEFNLVYDRGTQFGLATGGRTESILMSLPPVANWQYEGELAETFEEINLVNILKSPRNWV
ncbi:MAG TPA: oxygen-dependent coproporphyrinogen oxidase [Oligoflexia bacterium]|nr:oxygen-dependent coproporphyrinogen oxidase [Oligoflexia bacterium]HMP49660.1 oxygen-dependent coproporphyrinogen oxidase [Oligoflexia bacterium]